ncbi:MAG: heavy-metal-associated domain-containing protein [Bacteroidales bacterium]|nr:heavy-metal-associated domain-containing protein [Bacteroidales bacterium]
MKRNLILVLVAALSLSGFAQEKKTAPIPQKAAPAVQQTNVQQSTEQSVVIQTNGVCGMCKDRFMDNVPFFKGVKDCKYDMANAKLTVTYNSRKTSPDAIRQGISKLGYNADAVQADAAVRAKLPACCRADKKADGVPSCEGHH